VGVLVLEAVVGVADPRLDGEDVCKQGSLLHVRGKSLEREEATERNKETRRCFSNITHNQIRHWGARQGSSHLEGLDARTRRYARDNDLRILDPLNDLLVGVARVRRQIVSEGGVGPRGSLARDAAHSYAILGKDLGIRRRQLLSGVCPAPRTS
jgi:hypothetical protein